ncbi:MAG: acyl carrier protein [Planctomycetota bacterium]|nr:MAG: acyl carrier protein [Planctomycetota bacterium]
MSELEKQVTALVAEIFEMEDSELWEKRSQHFVEDLGIDSMLALEVLASLERTFRIEIPEESVLEMTSLDSTIGLVKAKVEQAAA